MQKKLKRVDRYDGHEYRAVSCPKTILFLELQRGAVSRTGFWAKTALALKLIHWP